MPLKCLQFRSRPPDTGRGDNSQPKQTEKKQRPAACTTDMTGMFLITPEEFAELESAKDVSSPNQDETRVTDNILKELKKNYTHVDPATGRIRKAVVSHQMFKFGGEDNKLADIGIHILDQILSGNRLQAERTIDFEKERARCLQERRLFEDPEFPARPESLFHEEADIKKENKAKRIVWKRPGELVDKPRFHIDMDETKFDVVQGELCDCWLLAAVQNLTAHPELFYRVVPPDQSFTENYAGIFHFQFWKDGKWVDIVVDDRLPVDRATNELIYSRSQKKQEFWSALLEKAYAKLGWVGRDVPGPIPGTSLPNQGVIHQGLYTTYQHLERGKTSEAYEDFTGGISEHRDLDQNTSKAAILEFLKQLMKGFKQEAAFATSIHCENVPAPCRSASSGIPKPDRSDGLRSNHAYSIVGISMVDTKQQYNGKTCKTALLRLRDPFYKLTYNGPFTDGHAAWKDIPEYEWKNLECQYKRDCGFMISIKDFVRIFNRLEATFLPKSANSEIAAMLGMSYSYSSATNTRNWMSYEQIGWWSKSEGTLGGQPTDSSFMKNPQYRLSLGQGKTGLPVVISVLQTGRREARARDFRATVGAPGVVVYKIPCGASKIEGDRKRAVVAERQYSKANRQAYVETTLLPGYDYIIVPYKSSDSEATFLLRVFSDGACQIERESGSSDSFINKIRSFFS